MWYARSAISWCVGATAGSAAAVGGFCVVRAGVVVRARAVFEAFGAGVAVVDALAAGFGLAARGVGAVSGVSVFRVVFAMNVFVSFCNAPLASTPARGFVQRRSVE